MDASWMSSNASMASIQFAALTPELEALLPQGNTDFSWVNQLSDIDVERTTITIGGRFNPASDFLLDVFYSLVDFNDSAPILEDDTGKYQVIWANVGWRF